MSKLFQQNGDDHPEAARKHLLDAQTLLQAQRFDGTAYLCGYVVECSLKSILLLEAAMTGVSSQPWSGKRGHDLSSLECAVATMTVSVGSKTARYVGTVCTSLAASPIITWNPEQRYKPERTTKADAEVYYKIAEDIYTETIAEMVLNGDA